MRLNFRLKIGNLTMFFMISLTQTLEGVTSKVIGEEDKHMHYIFWDLEGYNLPQVVKKLREVQREFRLGDIWIVSDAPKSYRAFCWSKRPFIEYAHILIHSFPELDFGFFIWTMRRTAATLRVSDKINRPKQQVVAFLKGYEETEFPKQLVRAVYDTGWEKRGRIIELGFK